MLRTHGADVPGPHVRSASLAGASRASSTTDGDGRQLFTVFLLAVALLFGVVAVARADVLVVFDDSNLRSAVVSQLVAQGRIPQGSDGTTITPSDMQTLTTLPVPDRGIARLEGLEDAVNLRSLDLGGNEIADITPLAGLTNLTDLDVVRNELDVTAGMSDARTLAIVSDS